MTPTQATKLSARIDRLEHLIEGLAIRVAQIDDLLGFAVKHVRTAAPQSRFSTAPPQPERILDAYVRARTDSVPEPPRSAS